MALEMKFGNDPKKTATLGVLMVVLVYLLYTNVFSTPDYGPPPSSAPTPTVKSGPLPPVSPVAAPPKKAAATDRRSLEFRPRVGPARPEDRPDPMSVDPTLRLELLARLEKVEFSGGLRSLFDFSNVAAPVAPSGVPVPKIIPTKKQPAPPKFIGPLPKPPDPVPPPPPPPPKAPPIPLKFYGYTSAQKNVSRRAFFLDGDDILVGKEGDTLKQRYKIIRIGLTNVTMEDLQFNQQQTLPIVPEGAGGGN
jgi:hypothetical protein